jgi:hypothetical protein
MGFEDMKVGKSSAKGLITWAELSRFAELSRLSELTFELRLHPANPASRAEAVAH